MQTVQKLQKGFTLIELMIVVAIIGILAAVALPAYQDYVAKSKITSIVATASAGKSVMFDRYADLGKMPIDGVAGGDAVGLPDSSTEGFYKIMKGLGYADGTAFTYTVANSDDGAVNAKASLAVKLANVNGNVNDKILTFVYQDDAGALSFECVNTGGLIKNKCLPKECHS